MARRSDTLFLSMAEVEVASSEPAESVSPAKVLIMEDVEVASMEQSILPPRNQLAMDEIEVASGTDQPLQPPPVLNMSEVEVQSSGVQSPQRPRAKRSRTAKVADKETAPGHPPDFEENYVEDNSPKLTKDPEDKADMDRNLGRNTGKSIYKKLNIISAKMDREFSMLHERLDALSGAQQSSEELMRPLKLSCSAEYNAFRKQAKFPSFRRKLISALVFNGGMSPEEMGIRCVDFMIDSEFQKEFSWFGRSQKIPFTECFANIIKDSVWKRFPNANFASVEQRVQRQLAMATELEGRTSRKRKLSEDLSDAQ